MPRSGLATLPRARPRRAGGQQHGLVRDRRRRRRPPAARAISNAALSRPAAAAGPMPRSGLATLPRARPRRAGGQQHALVRDRRRRRRPPAARAISNAALAPCSCCRADAPLGPHSAPGPAAPRWRPAARPGARSPPPAAARQGHGDDAARNSATEKPVMRRALRFTYGRVDLKSKHPTRTIAWDAPGPPKPPAAVPSKRDAAFSLLGLG